MAKASYGSKPKKSYTGRSYGEDEESNTSIPWRDYGATFVRGASGLTPGGPIGAAAGFVGEGLAQFIEGRPDFNYAQMGTQAALGAIPFGKAASLLKAAGKGALMGAGGTLATQQAEEGLHLPSGSELGSVALGGLIGSAGGAVSKKAGDLISSRYNPSEAPKVKLLDTPDTTPKVDLSIPETKIEAKVEEIARKAVQHGKYGLSFKDDIDENLYRLGKNPDDQKALSFLKGRLRIKEDANIVKEAERLHGKVLEEIKGKKGGKTELPKLFTGKVKEEKIIDTKNALAQKNLTRAKQVIKYYHGGDLSKIVGKTDDEILDLAEAIKPGFLARIGHSKSTLDLSSVVAPKEMPKVTIPEPKAEVEAPPTLWGDTVKTGNEVINFARNVQTAGDLSAPLRQGINNIHRKEFWQNLSPMIKSAINKDYDNGGLTYVTNHPKFETMRDAAVEFTERFNEKGLPTEEHMRSKWAEKLPFIRDSNRAYATFLNRLRADVFSRMHDDALKAGIDMSKTENLRAMGQLVNDMTGRGNLGSYEKHAEKLNKYIFSPKLIASRVNMLKRALVKSAEPGVDPVLAKNLRKEALKSMAAVGGLATTSIVLSNMVGAKGTEDPRSTDFGKLKIGNTRIDLTGGYQQYIRLAAQLATQQANIEGKVQNRNAGDTFFRFARNKLAPIAASAVDLAYGKDTIGEDTTLGGEVLDNIMPLILDDMYELSQEGGKEAALAAPLSFFGAGVSSYGKEKDTPSMFSRPRSGLRIKR